jgi:hypothetical protein
MQFFSTWRSLLAATAIFLLLSGSYELAGHWPGGEPVSATPTRQAQPVAAQPQAPAARPEPPVPLPTDAQLGYHRYVGTIGGRPVLAEVTLELQENPYPDTLLHAEWKGTFRYRDTQEGGALGQAFWFRADQSLETHYQQVVGGYYEPTAVLCAEQPPGPLLTGTYTPPGERQALPIHLQESYADGVRYELLHEESYGPARRLGDGTLTSAHLERVYLHLLGPDTLRPTLARLQCPPPAARRRARLRRLRQLASDDYYREFFDVTLNEGNLLAYTRYETQGSYGTRYDQEGTSNHLLDLRTGQVLSSLGQLRPGGLRQLRRLLTHQALADTAHPQSRAHWLQAGQLPLPREGFRVTPTGWEAGYIEPEFEEERYGYSQPVSWVTLRPLLRPGSPLHRLLPRQRLP